MKQLLFVALCLAGVGLVKADARFTAFSYRGEDALKPCDPVTEYRNPILGGMAPDPSLTRNGNDFYLANSSFSYFPGIPVYHSTDLVNWDFCGYVGDTVSKLRFSECRTQYESRAHCAPCPSSQCTGRAHRVSEPP